MKTLKELKQRIKREAGWKWYWAKFVVLFDFDFQYRLWLDRRFIKHQRKADKYLAKIKKLNSKI